MSFRSEFVASPESFMATNIVVPQFRGGKGPPSESRPIVITISEWTQKKCSKSGGKVYFLNLDTAGVSRDEKLPIYWLAYSQGNFTQGVLNGQSLYMFTAQMDGCTLGFGSQGGDGGCLVSHANKASAGKDGPDAQRDAQRGQLQSRFGGASFSMVEPSAYMGTTHGGNKFKATNFGKNVNGTWQFFSHRYMDSGSTGGVMLHGGVQPAVSIPG